MPAAAVRQYRHAGKKFPFRADFGVAKAPRWADFTFSARAELVNHGIVTD
jgi:hypothetical protein